MLAKRIDAALVLIIGSPQIEAKEACAIGFRRLSCRASTNSLPMRRIFGIHHGLIAGYSQLLSAKVMWLWIRRGGWSLQELYDRAIDFALNAAQLVFDVHVGTWTTDWESYCPDSSASISFFSTPQLIQASAISRTRPRIDSATGSSPVIAFNDQNQ